MSTPPGPRRPVPRPAGGRRLALVPSPPAPRGPAPAPAPPPGEPATLLRVLLGARLRRARTAQGRSLRDVAAVAGVSIGHLSQVERGLAESSSEVLAALCRALGVPLHVLLRAAAVDLTTREAPTAPGTTVVLTSLAARPRTAPGAGSATGPASGGVRAAA